MLSYNVFRTRESDVYCAVRFNGFYIFHPFETPEIAA